MDTVKITYKDGSIADIPLKKEKNENVLALTVGEKLDYTTVQKLDFPLYDEPITAGDSGYYLFPTPNCSIGYFHHREDKIYKNNSLPTMPLFGLKHKDNCFVAIDTGKSFLSYATVKISNDHYEFFMEYDLIEKIDPEDIRIEIHYLKGADANYSGMAREYRRYKMAGGLKTIRERANDELKYATESMLVRIRMGWKPVPTQVPEQTPENEPPMHVACTFKDVVKIMRAYKAAGIDKVEFSLVGWNIRGHDGRWPQILPVEPSLGGEEGLREVIEEGKKLGYNITCHTNSTDAYSIAENFRKEDMIVKKDGSFDCYTQWAGGTTYKICPKCSVRLAKETLPAVKDLGFRGLHYIDVMSLTHPWSCYSEEHPVTRKQCAEYWNEIAIYAKSLFGGMSSEGSFDFFIENLDSILYVGGAQPKIMNPIIDKYVPFWQLVYHGIVLSNPYAKTINATISDNPDNLLKQIEFGGRPVIYYYSSFINQNEGTWIGKNAFVTDSPEEFDKGVKCAAKQYEIYNELKYLQYLFMENHEEIADNVYETTYSDGSKTIVDYNNKTYKLIKGSEK